MSPLAFLLERNLLLCFDVRHSAGPAGDTVMVTAWF